MALTTWDKIRLFARGPAFWFGLIFFTLGLGTSTISDWLGIYFYFTPLASVAGRVAGSQETSFAIDEARVYETFYRYQVQGKALTGSSFATTTPMRPDTLAEVEYCLNRPTYSRLKNTSLAPFGLTGLLGSLAFMGWGLATTLKTIRPNWQLLAILEDAAITEATCRRLEAKTLRHEEEAEFVAYYAYQVDWQHYTHLFQTSQTSKFGIKEPIVYQQAVPADAALLASLPGFIRRSLSTTTR